MPWMSVDGSASRSRSQRTSAGERAVVVVEVAEAALVPGQVGAGAGEEVVAGGLVPFDGGEGVGRLGGGEPARRLADPFHRVPGGRCGGDAQGAGQPVVRGVPDGGEEGEGGVGRGAPAGDCGPRPGGGFGGVRGVGGGGSSVFGLGRAERLGLGGAPVFGFGGAQGVEQGGLRGLGGGVRGQFAGERTGGQVRVRFAQGAVGAVPAAHGGAVPGERPGPQQLQ